MTLILDLVFRIRMAIHLDHDHVTHPQCCPNCRENTDV